MAKFKPQYRRLLFIDTKIREGGFPNCTVLATSWEVDRKTILRDVAYLKWELDAPIEYHRVKRGYYYTEPNYRMPTVNISESDLFAICIAEKALEQYKHTPVYAKLASVFEKIQQSLPDNVSIHPSWVDARISVFAEPATKILPDVWQSLTGSIRENRTLRIDHQTPGEPSEAGTRDVDPYHLIGYRGQWYVIGRCHRTRKIRTFAVSRIKQARMLDEKFALPKDFDIGKLLGSHFGIMWGNQEYKVSIRFTGRVAPYIEERQWHPTQVIRRNRDGSLVLQFTTNHLNEVKDWVLSWGAAARVLAPRALVEKVRADLRDAVKQY